MINYMKTFSSGIEAQTYIKEHPEYNWELTHDDYFRPMIKASVDGPKAEALKETKVKKNNNQKISILNEKKGT